MIHFYEDDKRKNDPDFALNHGSFSCIHFNLNRELKNLGFYGEEGEAEWHGFSTGLGLDFGNKLWNRFVIHVWETNFLPQQFINFRHWAESHHSKPYKFFGLSKQISDLWESYGFHTPVIDIGVNENFYNPEPTDRPKDFKYAELFKAKKFIVSSVTALNFRSGFNALVEAIEKLDPVHYRFIVKNTDTRDLLVRRKIDELKNKGYDIHYICERLNLLEIREFYLRSNLLCYNVIQTSAGLPLTEAAACGCPTIVNDFCPTNIYPSTLKNKVYPSTIEKEKGVLCQDYGLPYTFPDGWIDESKALIYKVDISDFASNIENIRINYDFYKHDCYCRSFDVRKNWSWKHSANKLIKELYGN